MARWIDMTDKQRQAVMRKHPVPSVASQVALADREVAEMQARVDANPSSRILKSMLAVRIDTAALLRKGV